MMFQMQEVPSAGTRSGIAWRRQPKAMSGNICPATCRAATGAGFNAFSRLPGGAETVSGASDPALFGMPAATTQPRPKTV